MIVYHGSNIEIGQIDLQKCRPYKDFGQGFYTSIYLEQAQIMAERTARIYGGTATVSCFALDDEYQKIPGLHIKQFPEPNDEWALFVMNNRNKTFKDYTNLNCNIDGKYDIVEGPVANDDLVALLNLYLSGTISMQALQSEMTFRRLTHQISFHTEKAIGLLSKEA
ncbi:MAG: DUF3990 domain-containing protein [Spirochaetaceae bacterium]|jgi:hypothetical protein|nr:DUF3990 domain-containing protein [Spirochaetaceae bacterium]